MAEAIDELGPIDYLVIEFPGSKFNGKIAPELAKLVEDGLIRVLDLLVVKKDEDGTVEGFEVNDLDPEEHGGIHELDVDIAELLSEEDVLALAEAVEPGSSAGILVYENKWAAPFASAVRRSGGQLVASGRIPVQAIIASLEADEAEGA